MAIRPRFEGTGLDLSLPPTHQELKVVDIGHDKICHLLVKSQISELQFERDQLEGYVSG